MKELKKILCAVDFSDMSKIVASYANTFGEKFGSEVIVLYVAPSLTQYVGFHVPPASIETFVGEIVSGAEKKMDVFVQENFEGIQVRGVVKTGYPAEEILDLADSECVDMIVMGTHGRTGIDKILFGSVAEKVVKSSNVPVLTIRPEQKKD